MTPNPSPTGPSTTPASPPAPLPHRRRRLLLARPSGLALVAVLATITVAGLHSGARNTASSPGPGPAAEARPPSDAPDAPDAPTPPDATRPAAPQSPPARHPVRIRQPVVTPRVDTGLRDHHGQPVTASCASCHATSRPRPETHTAEELDEFHQGLTYAHGNLTCLSCHHDRNYDQLRLADGRGVEFADALQLCAQCHGPQYRDYRHGSHGGMTGYWDLRRGPRERNHCVDCQDPHSPAYPIVRPVFAPAPDRGLAPHRAPTP